MHSFGLHDESRNVMTRANTRKIADSAMQALPIVHKDRAADSVNTVAITIGFMREKGIADFMRVSELFVSAHSELRITLKWDRASNHGWVTQEEATAIRAHMDAALQTQAD